MTVYFILLLFVLVFFISLVNFSSNENKEDVICNFSVDEVIEKSTSNLSFEIISKKKSDRTYKITSDTNNEVFLRVLNISKTEIMIQIDSIEKEEKSLKDILRFQLEYDLESKNTTIQYKNIKPSYEKSMNIFQKRTFKKNILCPTLDKIFSN